MSTIKISVGSFHKRVLALNLLRVFYLLKKEFNTKVSFIIYKKIQFKIFNILKSPVQYKIARNQLTVQKHKGAVFLNMVGKYKNLNHIFKKNKLIASYLLKFMKSFILTSNCNWMFQKIFRV